MSKPVRTFVTGESWNTSTNYTTYDQSWFDKYVNTQFNTNYISYPSPKPASSSYVPKLKYYQGKRVIQILQDKLSLNWRLELDAAPLGTEFRYLTEQELKNLEAVEARADSEKAWGNLTQIAYERQVEAELRRNPVYTGATIKKEDNKVIADIKIVHLKDGYLAQLATRGGEVIWESERLYKTHEKAQRAASKHYAKSIEGVFNA